MQYVPTYIKIRQLVTSVTEPWDRQTGTAQEQGFKQKTQSSEWSQDLLLKGLMQCNTMALLKAWYVILPHYVLV